jgi:prepilin-type N-terminal cleavage/methylation domain-containing protein
MKILHKGEKGFTLIELLIVVAILGILAAVIIPNVTTFMDTGRLNAARTEAENVKTAALAYYADMGTWPNAGTDLEGTPDYIQGSIADSSYTFDNVTGIITDASYKTTAFVWNDTSLTFDKP